MAKNLSSASVNFSADAVSSTSAKTKGWESIGCINMSLTAKSTFKIGMVNLTVGNDQHVELFHALMGENKLTILTNILQKMVLTFNPADNKADLDFLEGMDDFEPVEVVKSDKEQAIGYLNVSLPTNDGELSQLGSIRLLASDINQARIFHSLNKAEFVEKNLAAIRSRLSANFYPTALGKAIGGGTAIPVVKKSYLAIVV